MSFIIFFSIVIGIYALINIYIYSRGLQAIPHASALRTWYKWGFWILALTYVAGRFLERVYIGTATDVLIWTGSFWLAAMLYFFLLVVVFDIVRLVNYLIPFLPGSGTQQYINLKFLLFTGSLLLVTALVAGGFINARNPRINNFQITIEKKAPGLERIRAVVMSDIHLGTLIGNGKLERIVNKVNALQPDIILLPGDILDEDLEQVIRQNLGQTLLRLNAPMGVYGIMGNHEYIGGGAQAYEYLKSHGITMLRDSSITINGSFVLVGREDRDKPRFTGRNRLSLEALLDEVNFNYPVILLDHQPYYLEQAASLGVDLQLSGHTHHGQLWPLNFVTKAIYTVSKGYGKIGNMHAYVSNGVGTWGPPVRIGNRPEILNLEIIFSAPE